MPTTPPPHLELVADDEASISGSSANSLPLVEGVESGFIFMRLMMSLVVSHDDTYGCMD